MSRFDQAWVDTIVAAASEAPPTSVSAPLKVLYIVTDTSDGKVAFHLEFSGGRLASGTAGKLPRGEKADVTLTATEDVFDDVWSGRRSRDAIFMNGDIKVEGAYELWLDDLVPAFDLSEWRTVWEHAVG